jgi:hypothetical protein
MDDSSAELIVNWYIELEQRLSTILATTLYNNQTAKIFLPPLVNIILDSCSLIDTIFREEYKGKRKRKELTINDYCSHFESLYMFSGIKSVIYQFPLQYIEPFKGWYNGQKNSYKGLIWWQTYNKLKHDRIKEYSQATLDNAISSVCALHQLISQLETFKKALLRKDFICFGQWGKEYALEIVYDKNQNKEVTILVETELFATPIGATFPDKIETISPFFFSYGRKLWRYVGREI